MGDDRRVLRDHQYVDPTKLQARQRLWSFASRRSEEGRLSWALSLRGDEFVVDVGCGNGRDLVGLRRDGHHGLLVGVDFSPGMLGAVSGDVASLVVGDALALPIGDGIADVVCAMHMLYHVPDIEAAVWEARRVLHDTGTFLASTNSQHAIVELLEPWSAAMVEAGGPPLERVSHGRFSLEAAPAILQTVFRSVEVKPSDVTAKVPDASVVRDYVASTDDLYRPMLPDDHAWAHVLDTIEAHAKKVIQRHGTYDITQRSGVLICSEPRPRSRQGPRVQATARGL